ncbi:RHS repeat domain-containing protein [Flavobacterium sp. LMO9]|uniref:RHS repeat domain-containing protein n=1 Tax=Flavobacterium sp. LMO9 TaxID=2654245 RepID=UPI00351A03A9
MHNYYAFGSLIPNRHSSSNNYRYGFQGQEKDDELKGEGNSLNYTFRMHDPRVGRFFAVDPLTKSYPHYTPYSFSGNRVIDAIELEGLEELILQGKMADFGEIFFEIISKDEILVKLYDKVQDETKCNIKLHIVNINPKKLKKDNNWGGRTYDFEDLKVMASNIKRVDDRKSREEQNGKKFKLKGKAKKTYNEYVSIFEALGMNKEDILNETEYEHHLILVNENNINENNVINLMNDVSHEVEAHFEENINGNKSVEHSHHYKFFAFNPLANKISEEEQTILDGMKKGYSPRPSQYKNGSEAMIIYQAVQRAVTKFKTEQKEKKKNEKKNKS